MRYYSALFWMKKKLKEEKWTPLGLSDLRAKGSLIHLESQLNATLPLPYWELELLLKATTWGRSQPSRSMIDVEKVSSEQFLQNTYTYFP